MNIRTRITVSALIMLSLAGCGTAPVTDTTKLPQPSDDKGSLSSFNFTIREGQKKWDFGALLRSPATVSTPSTRHGSCRVEAEPFDANTKGPTTDLNLSIVDKTSFTVLPLQPTATGVLALIKIEYSFSDVAPSVVSWEDGGTINACSFPQGTVQSGLLQITRVFEYGKPEKLKLKDAVYEITALQGSPNQASKR